MTNPEYRVAIDETASVADTASIGGPAVIEALATVGPGVRAAAGLLLMEGAVVCPNPVKSVSKNGRSLQSNVSVGPGVRLHDEVELGYGATIPTQGSIAHIGSFGAKNRVITIYGSDAGPLFSLGCHVGVVYGELERQILASTHSSRDSAASYERFLGTFSDIGSLVQKDYQANTGLVKEIKDRRRGYALRVADLSPY